VTEPSETSRIAKEGMTPTGSVSDVGSARDRFTQAVNSRQTGNGEQDTEETLWQGNYSPLAMVGTAFLVAILTIGIVAVAVIYGVPTVQIALIIGGVAWVIFGIYYATRRFGIAYELTSQRFIHQTGLLSRRTDRIEVIDIEDVSFIQGPIQRILGIGTIDIASTDRSHPLVHMPGIANVKEVAGLIDDVRRRDRKRRSLHIQTI
jgi:membrane protein YdbS with pleckstrin-like domain